MPPHRRTAAVTLVGVLLLPPAAFCALVTIKGTGLHVRHPVEEGVFLVAAAIFGYAGSAIILRWPGWRIWAGTIGWGLIALVVLSLFKTPPLFGPATSFDLRVFLVTIAFAVFVLLAKRRERKPDLAAVFDD